MDYAAKGSSQSNFVPSRFPLLDKTLGGGFIRGGLYIVGARPAVGKSSFAVNLADTIHGNVLFVSLEMSPEQITGKRFSRRTGIPTGRLLSGRLSEEEWGKLAQASDILSRSGVYINDRYSLTVSGVQDLAESIPVLQAVIVDYLGLIQPASRGGSAYENTTQISRDLKRLALSLNVPIICLCQLSRSVEGREDKRPRLSDLRDSGAIEQDADAVMFLYRDDYYKGQAGDSSIVNLNVAKNRHGGLGTIDFQFFRAISGFKEVP
jgi:replicative DNA helicase